MSAPYKVVPYDLGAAHVIDRSSGEKVGYVVQWANGWSAYLMKRRGKPLVVGVRPVPEHLVFALGKTEEVLSSRYRAEAAALVWRTHQERNQG